MVRQTLFRTLLITGALLAAVGWTFRGRLPAPETLSDDLLLEPIQLPLEGDVEDRQIIADGMTYNIHPLFEYSLHGLVVTEHDTRSWSDYYHSLWQDSLNVKDICVAWGQNISTGVYEKMKFTSGSWTCYCEFMRNTGPDDWALFRADQFSNNHLLPATPEIRRTILSTKRGDQVRLSGYLCEYSHNGGFRRGTSTRRDDTGNGACETILVEEYEIIEPANRVWHFTYAVGLFLFVLGIAGTVVGFFIDNHRSARELDSIQTYDILGNPE